MSPLYDSIDSGESVPRKRKRTASLPELSAKRRLLTPPQLSREQVEGTDSGSTTLRPATLTEKNLKLHTKAMGGTRKTPSSTTIVSINTQNEKAFGQQLQRNGIAWGYPETEQAAQDITNIQEYLDRGRSSPEPDQEQYKRWRYEISQEDNEASTKWNMWTRIAKHSSGYDLKGYRVTLESQWCDADSSVTYKLSDPKPDILESFRIGLYPERVVEELGESIQPSSQQLQAMPTFCVEWKGAMVALSLAIKQAAYDGAVMAKAAYTAQEYMGRTSSDLSGKTQALTMAINGLQIKIFGHHMDDNDSERRYKMFQLKSFDTSVSLEAFRDAYKAVRNAQDWARERATRTMDELREHDSRRPPEIKWLLDKRRNKWYENLADGTKRYAEAPGKKKKAAAPTPPSTKQTAASISTLASESRPESTEALPEPVSSDTLEPSEPLAAHQN